MQGGFSMVLLFQWSFILGGVLNMAQSIWEALAAWTKALAPLVYHFNGLADLQWAQQIREREKSKKKIVKEWNSYQSMSTDSNVSTTASASQLLTLVWHQRLHKYTAHRRSILAAATFDIAALLALSQFLYHQANTSGRARSTLALTKTLFSMTGRSTYPRLRVTSEQTENKSHHVLRVPEVLEDLCDLSFLIGSLMDSMLDDVRVSAHFDTWAIVSSLLWLIDACLYLQSNFVMASRVKKSHDIKSDSCFV